MADYFPGRHRAEDCFRRWVPGNVGRYLFDQALFDLYEADQITYDDALRYADSQNELRLRIKLEGKAAHGKEALEGLDHLSLEQGAEDKGTLMR